MFTGIIEEVGLIRDIRKDKSNVVLSVEAKFLTELKIDQSISHNGVCLTVSDLHSDYYEVTVINETLDRSNIGELSKNSIVNLERCMRVGDRLDGHFVQGHVDTQGTCSNVDDINGSWVFTIDYPKEYSKLLVPKGSVTINGVSLTVVDAGFDQLSIAIIPYTYLHTNFKTLEKGDKVNLEFDILGKYLLRQQEIDENILS
jgi:riboflavin synthase, alpha subunit